MAGEKLVADSMVVAGDIIEAVGLNLQYDPDFRRLERINLRGRAVFPGFCDSHTHFYFMAVSLNNVKLDGLKSLEQVLARIKSHSAKLGPKEWVFGEGISPDRWQKYVMPDRIMLDKVTGGRPAAIFSKDQHLVWVNSAALRLARIDRHTPQPEGGRIERFLDGEPSGILKEIPAYFPVIKAIKPPAPEVIKKSFNKILGLAYSRGVTGVHSFDGPDAFRVFLKPAFMKNPGLRISYYPPPSLITELKKRKIRYNFGNDYIRIGGIKIFADGSLGSQSALCFQKYKGSVNNFGVETISPGEMLARVRAAAAAGLPCAIHAIGDKAIANVLDCYEKAPIPKFPARHRIEHLQMIRRSDISRLKKMNIIASMQPSHCPSDVSLIEKYWGPRGRNCFIFNTLLKKGVGLVFGSDSPIEPLDPIAGIDAAVNRLAPGRKAPFYPEERISPYQALHGFTAGTWDAVGRGESLGRLLPGYKADFVVLSQDICRIPSSKIKKTKILATYFNGRTVFEL